MRLATVLKLDSAGVAIRRPREWVAPAIGTATGRAFELPDSNVNRVHFVE